jgi:hypothetical protein
MALTLKAGMTLALDWFPKKFPPPGCLRQAKPENNAAQCGHGDWWPVCRPQTNADPKGGPSSRSSYKPPSSRIYIIT